MGVPSIKDDDPDDDPEPTEDVEQNDDQPADDADDDSMTDPNTDDADDNVDQKDDQPTDDEDNSVDVDPVDMPDDDDDVDATDGSSGGLLSGSTFGISNKILLGIGVAAIVLALLLADTDTGGSSADRYEDNEDVHSEAEESSETVQQSGSDPLSQGGGKGRFSHEGQQTAIETVFGGSGE